VRCTLKQYPYDLRRLPMEAIMAAYSNCVKAFSWYLENRESPGAFSYTVSATRAHTLFRELEAELSSAGKTTLPSSLRILMVSFSVGIHQSGDVDDDERFRAENIVLALREAQDDAFAAAYSPASVAS
jgi:hypothetical protein